MLNATHLSTTSSEASMLLLSSTDVAIAAALSSGTLRVEQAVNRFGDDYVAISDGHGLIEVALSTTEAAARLADVEARAAA